MQRDEKERVVAELTERLRSTPSLIVADYRGLTNAQLEALRDELVKHGARFTVVKNTLTRRAAEAAGADMLLALLEGPSAIAFIEADGDPVAVAKALGDVARDTRVLVVRGGVLEGRSLSPDEVESLAKLPPLDVLRGQVIGAVIAPLNAIAALVNAPLQNLVGLIDARIEQLGGAEAAAAEPVDAAEAAGAETPVEETDAGAAPSDEAAAAATPDEQADAGATPDAEADTEATNDEQTEEE
jgi:large subunit ribosomal protein L10